MQTVGVRCQNPDARHQMPEHDLAPYIAKCAIVTVMSQIRDDLYQLHASVCKGFADPKRLILINALRDGEVSVSELCEITGIQQTNASQHLAILKSKGLVRSRREGQRVFYEVTSPKINEALDLLLSVMAEQIQIPVPSTP